MTSLMATWWRRRQSLKKGQEALRLARHFLVVHEDVLESRDTLTMRGAEARCVEGLSRKDAGVVEENVAILFAEMGRMAPPRRFPALQENLEVLVVAVAVAMAFRTYFIQPFKIPTGSMQPTLYGIHSEPGDGARSWFDRMPLKVAKWLVWGTWYREVTVKVPGIVRGPFMATQDEPSICYYYVGPVRYEIPRDAVPRRLPGERASAGDVLWAGRVTAGDHVFVNKVAWNLSRPRRGSIMVFSTEDIASLPPGTHYIKRMAGTPGDRVSIDPPNLMVNGERLRDPAPVRKISDRVPPYDRQPYGNGYIPPSGPEGRYLLTPRDEVRLGGTEYFALGDNTANSRDGRYWGTVPQKNLVGPAVVVYWPYSDRWGRCK